MFKLFKRKKTKRGAELIALSYAFTFASVFILIFKFFYPYHIIIAIAVYFANWAIFLYGIYKTQGKNIRLLKHRKKMISITLLALVAVYLFYVLIPIRKIEFLGMSKKQLTEKVNEDFVNVKIYTEGLNNTMVKIEEIKKIFETDNLKKLNEEEKIKLVALWADYLDYQIALNKLVDDYKYFYQINYFTNKKTHAVAFLIGYASYVASYSNGIKLVDYTINNKLFETLLDDTYPEYGIPPKMYAKLKYNVLHANDVLRLNAGYAYYKFLNPVYEKMGLPKNQPDVFTGVENSYKATTAKLKNGSFVWFPTNAIDLFKERTYTVWFPIQKNIAKGLGHLRLTTRDENFITKKQISDMKELLEPGDILVERKNWYSSNVGIPGFWPHSALYIGNIDELKSYFNNEEINNYIISSGFKKADDIIKKTNKKFFDKYQDKSFDVIEALAPGVIIKPLAKSANADHVGVLRPKLSKLEKFKAILIAISHYEKKYDYHFDFITDSELVCSELIYKAYNQFLNLELTEHAGKPILSASDLVRKFDYELGADKQELDFVYYLKGDEEKQKAYLGSEEEFRKTWLFTKWDLLKDAVN